MHFNRTTSLFFTALSHTVFSHGSTHEYYDKATSTSKAATEPPFNFTYLFTAHLVLGPTETPITIPGGVRLASSILNGTVTGPAINATIGHSLLTPSITGNGSILMPVVNAVGVTDDGFPFYLYGTGIGSLHSQLTRFVSAVSHGLFSIRC